MFQQQVYILNMGLMALDALCVFAAGYGAFYIKYYLSDGLWSMDRSVFVASVMLVMLLNNYMMGKFHLYSDRKSPPPVSLLWSMLGVVFVAFAFLSTAIFFFKQVTYSRLFLLSFAALTFIFLVIQRGLSQLIINLSLIHI